MLREDFNLLNLRITGTKITNSTRLRLTSHKTRIPITLLSREIKTHNHKEVLKDRPLLVVQQAL